MTVEAHPRARREPVPYRFVYLLAAQLALIALAPVLAGEGTHPRIGAFFVLGLLVAALAAVRGDRSVRIAAAMLATPAIAGALVAGERPGSPVLVPAVTFAILFLAFVTFVIFRNVVLSRVVTTETLYGAVAAYLLLGLTWGWTYGLVGLLQPGSFRSLVKPDGRVEGPEYMFLSFITLTSVGYGDIVPVSAYARMLAILEAVAGQMYLAVFIARLVGLHGQNVGPRAHLEPGDEATTHPEGHGAAGPADRHASGRR